MVNLWLPVILCAVFLFWSVASRKYRVRFLFSSMLIAYLSIGAPIFWEDFSQYDFAGGSFRQDQVSYTVSIYAMWIAVLTLVSSLGFPGTPKKFSIPTRAFFKLCSDAFRVCPGYNTGIKLLSVALLAIGLFCATYSLSSGVQGVGTAEGGFQRIAYQVSDILVPLTAFALLICNQVLLLLSSLPAAVYFLYSGFRYKLIFLFAPLLYAFIVGFPVFGLNNFSRASLFGRGRLFRLSIAAAVIIFFFLFLSALTIARSKFSDSVLTNAFNAYSYLFQNPLELMGYPFFAESNVIFGLAASLFPASAPEYSLLNLLTDTLTEITPRFLFPDKPPFYLTSEIGHLIGGGLTSVQSATYYPFLSPFLLLRLPLVISFSASAIFAGLAIRYFSRILISSFPFSGYIANGLSEFCVYLPLMYCFVLRGSPPFIIKVVIFAILPLVFLLRVLFGSREYRVVGRAID